MATDWLHTFHEAACISSEPHEVCDRCGASQDRAIHSEGYARKNGHDFVPLERAPSDANDTDRSRALRPSYLQDQEVREP